MRQQDNKRFVEALYGAMDVVGGQVSERALKVWWNALADYDIEAVERALQQHVTESVYPPKPADVVRRVQGQDGRPDADEAWNIALQAMDESATVVWNDEIAEAKSAADPIFAEGDKVGARMAFRSAYERRVDEARKQGRPVKWWITAGQDKQERIEKTEQALLEGKVSRGQALPHLREGGEISPSLAAPVRELLADMSSNDSD